MQGLTRIVFLLAPIAALAAPSSSRRAAQAIPPPCEAISPAPTANETEARFNQFANAFIVEKDLDEAFTYISDLYDNHNPYATQGTRTEAYNILSPVWSNQQITVLGTTFESPMGWLHYQSSSAGEVVDRYRWEAGCIVEHWDQGETYPG